MIDPGTGQLGFRIALMVVLGAIGCLFIVEPGSAAFYADIITLFIGAVFLGILVLLIRGRKQ
jgi:hypothetical protein